MEEKMRSTHFKTFTVCNVLFLTLTQEHINILTGYIRSQPPTVTRSDSHVAAPRRHGDGGA